MESGMHIYVLIRDLQMPDCFFDKTREYERVVEEIGRLACT